MLAIAASDIAPMNVFVSRVLRSISSLLLSGFVYTRLLFIVSSIGERTIGTRQLPHPKPRLWLVGPVPVLEPQTTLNALSKLSFQGNEAPQTTELPLTFAPQTTEVPHTTDVPQTTELGGDAAVSFNQGNYASRRVVD